MQIQLKQPEIIKGIKMYIESQGISLNSKAVDMSFTAGRKDSGLSVEIVIEDATYAATAQQFVTPPVNIKEAAAKSGLPESAIQSIVDASARVDRETQEIMEELDAEEGEAAPTKGASLFG